MPVLLASSNQLVVIFIDGYDGKQVSKRTGIIGVATTIEQDC